VVLVVLEDDYLFNGESGEIHFCLRLNFWRIGS